MKKSVITLLLLIGGLSIEGKTIYIPVYNSYVFLQQGNDSVKVSSAKPSLELESFDKQFTLAVHHEEVTLEKVKAIKRANRTAGWSTFNTMLSVIAPGKRGSLFSRIQDIRQSSILLKMDKENANAEKVLSIEVWIDNNSDKELIVNDMIRGLAWYIRPKESLKFELSNPDLARLRVGDINNQSVCYATIGVGSMVNKWQVGWEDDESWIVAVYKKQVIEYEEYENLENYRRISKTDYSEKDMTIEEYKAFIKEQKRQNNR